MSVSPTPPMLNMAPINVELELLLSFSARWEIGAFTVLWFFKSSSDVYNLSFPDDRKFLKVLVYGIFTIETIQTALNGVDMYHWFGSGWGSLEDIMKPKSSAMDVAFISGIVSFIIQVFFCHRISTLNKSLWWLTILISLVGSYFYGGRFVPLNRSPQISLLQAIGGMGSGIQLWLLGDAVADLMIATSMTILAHSYFCIPYSNTLLVTLNNRLTLRAIDPDGSSLHISYPNLPVSTAHSAGQSHSSKRPSEAGPRSDAMSDHFKVHNLTDKTTSDVIRLANMNALTPSAVLTTLYALNLSGPTPPPTLKSTRNARLRADSESSISCS
ncbi:hypothetical protein FA95DRAFT_1570746 [Auriscalpium vulgare]|uniref:Uncharacterized protein n=1 Tax=Auriscalpium vulgare TaxID=40419 RepID=A0ACB8S345_9AGAM|nr:hypothetical protein FA95DRAFT_1570746 [Auriscalpium vulgare]